MKKTGLGVALTAVLLTMAPAAQAGLEDGCIVSVVVADISEPTASDTSPLPHMAAWVRLQAKVRVQVRGAPMPATFTLYNLQHAGMSWARTEMVALKRNQTGELILWSGWYVKENGQGGFAARDGRALSEVVDSYVQESGARFCD